MTVDIEAKSKELKDFVGQFETSMFLGDISSLMQFIRFDNQIESLQGLSSPQRQLLYLAGLNISSPTKSTETLKAQYSDDEFKHIKKMLIEIEEGYEQFFYPKPGDIIDEDWKIKRKVAMPTFLSYFNQGLLNYEEQIIERIEEYFSPFETEIKQYFGLSIKDFIDIYNFIDNVPNNFMNENINKKEGQQTWEEFGKEMEEKKIMPWDWQSHMPKHFQEFFGYMYDKGKMYRYSKKLIIDKFGIEKTESFLNAFTCKREETDFLYYTEKNPIHTKPIFNIDDNEFQIIEAHQLIQAVYTTLLSFCISGNLNEKFYANRGKKLETKIEKIFKRFFRDKAFVHKSYYTQEKHEQDLLFLYKGMALIVEAKASKRDEPRREPEKAYPLILSNFEEVIQKGYDQAYRVKSKFIDNEILHIYTDQKLKKHVIDVRTRKYYRAFSIVVTLERFGQIQTDLDNLLEIFEDDEFPWSICVDDLEVFLLQMEKQRMKHTDLSRFLTIREKLHEKVITGDELEICGAFLTKKITLKNASDDNIFALTPDLTDIFDHSYHNGGLGFANEKNMDKKTSDKYLRINGF